MKIMFSIPTMSGGGAERVVSLIGSELISRGHEISVYSDFNNCVYNLNPKIKTIQSSCMLLSFSGLLEFRKIFKNVRPDVIVTIMTDAYIVALISLIGIKVPIIASDHTSFERKLPWHQNFIRKYLYGIADITTILTNRDFKILNKRIANKRVIPNPVEIPNSVKDMQCRVKQILAVGRLDFWHIKGFDLLIHEWSKVCSKFPDWKLVIIGSGSCDSISYLRRLASDAGISEPQFEVMGFKSNISEYMQNSSIFILSSRVEGFGLVLLEAMANGCACIALDSQGRQSEILNDSGIIIDVEDYFSLSVGIKELINNSQLRETFSTKAQIQAKRYSVSAVTDLWENLFKDL